MKPRLVLACLAAAILMSPVFSARAHAEFTPGACKQDEEKFCASVELDKRFECMKQHEADFSQACKDNIAAGKANMQKKMKEAKDACKEDLKQYCANVTPGEGREIACLKSYSDKISTACKEKLPKRMTRHGKHHEDGATTTPPPPAPPTGK